jgi:catechol 2,3-dioxygenase-like lactoylglutathione lyase family enzyme
MSCRLDALTFSANDPERLAAFWAGVLGWKAAEDDVALEPPDDTGFRLRFVLTDQPKALQNRVHVDLTSTSLEQQQETVERALALGGRHCDVGQRPDEEHVVLADPEGNEFCVIEPGNGFLAECGFVGALACDGSQEVGYFWSEALSWPLVWDQDQETAIRSPHGGPKITWGGPPLMPKPPRNRLHFDVVADGDRQQELDRLLSLGATCLDESRGEMADPDGNEFCLAGHRSCQGGGWRAASAPRCGAE